MTEPLRIDCPSATDVPSADRLRALATDQHHVVLRFPPEEFTSPQGTSKASLVQRLAAALPEYSVFDSLRHAGTERITILKVVRSEAVLANAAEFVAALRLFRRTASALAVQLAGRLGVAPDRLLDFGRDRDRPGWWDRARGFLGLPLRASRLDREWAYGFHGLECRFENRTTGQVVEVRIGFGSEFGVLDPYFFALFVKSTPELTHLARLLVHNFHDAARVLDVLQEAGYLRMVRGRFGNGLVVRDEGEPPAAGLYPANSGATAMTEAEWNTCTDPEAMLNCLRGTRRISERKARLFAVACCRQIWRLLSQEDSQQAVEIAELYADGRATASQLRTAERRATEVASALEWEATVLMRMRAYASKDAAQAAAEVARKRLSPKLTALKARAAIAATPERPKDQGNVLRDLLGPLPFREVPIDPAWLAWNGGTIPKLAEAIYEERTFESMPVLADALEEAGCDSEEMLFHCRQQGHLHVRGCWVLDLLLGKQ